METLELGPLKCRIEGDPGSAELTAIFCHGFGAPGTDLVPLGQEIYSISENLRDRVAFVFPEAPLSLDEMGMPGGRAWWEINMMRLQQMLETNQIDALVKAEPPGLEQARELYLEFLGAFQRKYSVETSQLVLGGFSQGAMLTTDVFLRSSWAPAALCLYSGTTLCYETWNQLAAGKPKLPILQSHGTQDPILPFTAAILLRDLLNKHGQDVEFLEFAGPHTIPYEGLQRTANLLEQLLK